MGRMGSVGVMLYCCSDLSLIQAASILVSKTAATQHPGGYRVQSSKQLRRYSEPKRSSRLFVTKVLEG